MERAAYFLIFLYFLRRMYRKLLYRPRLPVRRCTSRETPSGYSRLVIAGNDVDLCSNFCVKTPRGFYSNGLEEHVEEELARMFSARIMSVSGGEYCSKSDGGIIVYRGKLAPRDVEFDENGEGAGVPGELRGILAAASEEFVRLMR